MHGLPPLAARQHIKVRLTGYSMDVKQQVP